MIVHLVTKLGTAANDAATSLKLLEKGLKKEDLALAVLIDFPFQILFGYLAAKWSKGEKPLRPVRIPELAERTRRLIDRPSVADRDVDSSRLGSRLDAAHLQFSAGRHRHVVLCARRRLHSRVELLEVSSRSFSAVSALTISPRSTVQFVGISAFHTQIADPLIGGTYMTVCRPSLARSPATKSDDSSEALEHRQQSRRDVAQVLRSQGYRRI